MNEPLPVRYPDTDRDRTCPNDVSLFPVRNAVHFICLESPNCKMEILIRRNERLYSYYYSTFDGGGSGGD